MSAEVVLAARGLIAGYGGGPVVRDLDLDVRAGEVCVLLGANGAGKSTTLLALGGEIPLMSGSVEWHGAPWRVPLWRRARAGLSSISAEHAVVRGLSVWDNLRLTQGPPQRGLDLFPELVDHRARPAGLLSGGQQRMLSLAMALCREPRVLLADELSLGLAPLIVARLLRAIRQAADDGVAVLLVEQHARQALEIADRAVVLARGAVVTAADAASVRARFTELADAYLATPTESPRVKGTHVS